MAHLWIRNGSLAASVCLFSLVSHSVVDGVFCLQNRQLCSSRPVRASLRALPLIASYNARQLRVLTASTHTQGPVRESETMGRPSKMEGFQVAEF